jgi:flavin-binding protein dodecin
MENSTFKQIEIVGTSNTSVEQAISSAIEKANESLHNIEWFEVLQTRGKVSNGKVDQYQVILKIGLKLD